MSVNSCNSMSAFARKLQAVWESGHSKIAAVAAANASSASPAERAAKAARQTRTTCSAVMVLWVASAASRKESDITIVRPLLLTFGGFISDPSGRISFKHRSYFRNQRT